MFVYFIFNIRWMSPLLFSTSAVPLATSINSLRLLRKSFDVIKFILNCVMQRMKFSHFIAKPAKEYKNGKVSCSCGIITVILWWHCVCPCKTKLINFLIFYNWIFIYNVMYTKINGNTILHDIVILYKRTLNLLITIHCNNATSRGCTKTCW